MLSFSRPGAIPRRCLYPRAYYIACPLMNTQEIFMTEQIDKYYCTLIQIWGRINSLTSPTWWDKAMLRTHVKSMHVSISPNQRMYDSEKIIGLIASRVKNWVFCTAFATFYHCAFVQIMSALWALYFITCKMGRAAVPWVHHGLFWTSSEMLQVWKVTVLSWPV